MRKAGTLFLIPVPIAPEAWHTLAPEVMSTTQSLTHYFAEDARTCRRMLRGMHASLVLESIQISEINKHEGPDLKLLEQWLSQGIDIGIMSESGCPGIADPGALLVARAHQLGIQVVPLTGPSSLLLALMASGLNGQQFAFQGYLPVKEPARSTRIRQLEQQSAKEQQTQIFIETPYRNNPLLADLLQNLKGETRLCIAQNMTAPNAFVQTKRVDAWKKQKPELAKEPCVFLFLAS